MYITIKDMREEERPRERLIKYGVNSLSNVELLSIVLKSGVKGLSVKSLSSFILKECGGLEGLENISINKLLTIKGIGNAKASELISSIELGKRIYYIKNKVNTILDNSYKVNNYFKDLFVYLNQEKFYVVCLNQKKCLINYKCLFVGSLNSSVAHPREIFKEAINSSSAYIIIMHNHPSGDDNPSIQDIELTSIIKSASIVMGIPLIDHIIFGNNSFYSFSDHKLL
ncbi:MAG: DNA repair protein RadC [Bacilli bacterium]